ncbi:MAG: RHS repeat-associated core domain-containing protein [Kangiellaceae bacterium]|jgi:RHS repeat-associated protein|nr:RHS repeat-associated core domain-containing protein [Kangiellaceae bacterium]
MNTQGTYFQVERKNGLIEHYGAVAELGDNFGAEQSPNGLSKSLSWMLARQEQASGNNAIHYKYTVNNETGEALLSTIFYTSDSTALGDRKVDFNYRHDRPDMSTSYMVGGKLRSTKLLSEIVTSYGAARVASYKLVYSSTDDGNIEPSGHSGRTILRGVKQCGDNDSTCLPPTYFKWSEQPGHMEILSLRDQNNLEIVDFNQSLYNSFPHGDFNGDGVKDWQNAFISPEGERETHNLGTNLCRYVWSTKQTVCIDGDFDNNGMTDKFNSVDDKLQLTLLTRVNGNIHQQDILTDINYKLGSFGDAIVHTGDYNGDGWTDLIVNRLIDSQHRIYFYPNTRNIAMPYRQADAQEIYRYSQIFDKPSGVSIQYVGDMDGNGIPDFIISHSDDNLIKPYMSRLLLTQNNAGQLSFIDKNINFFGNQLASFSMLFDINSDGLSDIIGWKDETTGLQSISAKINLGDGSFSNYVTLPGTALTAKSIYHKPPNREPSRQYTVKYEESLHVFDFNNDGKQDLLFPGTRVATGCVLAQHQNQLQWRCGDNVYERTVNTGANNQQVYGSISAEYDFSLYQFKAMVFDEDINGDIVARVVDTPIIGGAGKNTKIIDAFGKGLPDVLFRYGCTDLNSEICSVTGSASLPSVIVPGSIYYNRNAGAIENYTNLASYRPGDLMLEATNAFGHSSQWHYLPLSSSQTPNASNDGVNYDFYSLTDQETEQDSDGQFAFSSSMYAVSQFSQSNGIGGFNHKTYQYRGAVYNVEGRGFQGFRQIKIDNPVSFDEWGSLVELRTVTDFNQTFPLAGAVKETRTCLVNDSLSNSDCSTAPLSRKVHTYETITTINPDVLWPYPSVTQEWRYDLTSRQQLNHTKALVLSVDNYGNILSQTTEVDSGFGTILTTTVNQYDVSVNEWWINKLRFSETETDTVNRRNSDIVVPVNLDAVKKIRVDYQYDPSHRKPSSIVTSAVKGEGKTVSLETTYTLHGLPDIVTTSSDGEVSRTVDNDYSTDGYFISKVTNALGHGVRTVIDPKHGQVRQLTDANGLVSATEYDPFGRPIEVSVQGAPTAYKRYHWCASNCASNAVYTVTTTQAGSPKLITHKDLFNRPLLGETEGFGGESIYSYTTFNGLGQTLFESVPSTNINTTLGTNYLRYDALGRLTEKQVSTAGPSGMYATSYTYNGFVTEINVSGMAPMSRVHNGLGQLMKTADSLGNETKYAYDSAGNPIVIEDANTNQITASYNALGQKRWVNDPNMGLKSFTYTGFGEVQSETDANGDTYYYWYDQLGRMTRRYLNVVPSISNSNLAEALFDFDNQTTGTQCLGMPSRELKPAATGEQFGVDYRYDSLCRLVETKTSIDGTTYSMKAQFDNGYGRPLAKTYPNGLTVGYRYNSQGYLTETYNVTSGYVYRHITGMNEWGQLKAAKLANNEMSLTNVLHESSGQMMMTFIGRSATTLQSWDYEYDDLGNLVYREVNNYEVGQIYQSYQNYTYDGIHRLTSVSTTIVEDTLLNHDVSYDYDNVGNFKFKSDYSESVDGSYLFGNVGKSFGGNAGPNAVRQIRLAGGGTNNFNYDNNGNLTSDNDRSITYNAFNKPLTISKAGGSSLSFSYGADQMRYKQVNSGDGTTTIYIGKEYEKVISSSEEKEKIYLDDIAIVTETTTIADSSKKYKIAFAHRDRLGSATAFYDHRGELTETRSFDAFGKPLTGRLIGKIPPVLDSDVTDRGFTDHEHLDDVELIHMNGRAYDYNLGRFLSVDPFIQAPGNSQSMNPYSYIMNNPLAGTDPSGYSAKDPVNKRVAFTGSRIKRQVTQTSATSAGTIAAGASSVSFSGSVSGVSTTTTVQSANSNGASDPSDFSQSFERYNNLDGAIELDFDVGGAGGGTSENQHVPLTGDERQFAKDGMLKEYWNSRHDRGDPWAAAGLALWDSEHEAVTDAHRDMAKVLQGRLIYEGVASGNLSSSATLGEMKTFMKDVGVAVMRGHAVAVQRDFSGKLGDRHGVLDKYQAAVFHHKVFSGQGLRPFVYGGTPIGVGNYVPFINIQAKVSNWVAGLNPSNKAYCGYMCFGQGYISNEDTHHDPAGR